MLRIAAMTVFNYFCTVELDDGAACTRNRCTDKSERPERKQNDHATGAQPPNDVTYRGAPAKPEALLSFAETTPQTATIYSLKCVIGNTYP